MENKIKGVLPELGFIGRERCRRSSDDVSVTAVTTGGKKKIAFTFRNGVAEIIAPNCSCIMVAPLKNRVFFKEDEGGFKASVAGQTNPNNKYMRIGAYEELKDFIGDYELKFDQYYELYYIEKDV